MNPMDDLQKRMAAELAEIERTRMPFGRFSGAPIYNLPAEYLQWFATKGWPRGRLGELLQIVYQMKADGADVAFSEMRKRAAGGKGMKVEG
jgi:uncharacterized protein (DUF3820 family)